MSTYTFQRYITSTVDSEQFSTTAVPEPHSLHQ